MKLRAQIFSGARSASGTVGPEMTRKDFNKRPIRASEQAVYLDKFSVITNAKQMRMVCRDFTNFVPEGTIFKGTVDNICPG